MFLGTLLGQRDHSQPWHRKKNVRAYVSFAPQKKHTWACFESAKNVHGYVFLCAENILMYVFLVGNATYVSCFGTGHQLCL